MAKFNGIVQFHDGLAVSDYLNMVPLGDTCVDRIGDSETIPPPEETEVKVRGTFTDSLHNVYVVFGPTVYRYSYNENLGTMSGPEPMKMLIDGEVRTFQTEISTGPVTFCESSLKPSAVFLCDGQNIYAWATYDGLSRPQYHKFMVNVMCPPNVSPTEDDSTGKLVLWDGDTKQPDFNSVMFGEDRYTENGKAIRNQFAKVRVDMVDWFDNRLVAAQLSQNTVWLTRTDPTYYWRDPTVAYLDPSDSATGGYELWPNWYSSSANADRLRAVKAFMGQLYFFNEHSIEQWGRTGNEDAPIQSATVQTLQFGGSKPVIIDGVMFFIGNDSVKDRFVGAFSPQFSKVSNREIEKHLDGSEQMECISMWSETFLFIRHQDGSGLLYGAGRWWRWETPEGAEYSIVTSLAGSFAVTNRCSIAKFDKDSRTSGGKPIQRAIRDGFTMLPKRSIIRKIELVADTGRTDGQWHEDREMAVYCAVSVNRGLSFSQRRYRTMGRDGRNDKTIEWRNMGSCNSVLVEIGTSSPHKLQVYDILINV